MCGVVYNKFEPNVRAFKNMSERKTTTKTTKTTTTPPMINSFREIFQFIFELHRECSSVVLF